MKKTIKHKISGVVETYRGVNIYHATDEKGKKGYRITSVISRRLFTTIEAAKNAIKKHDTKLGYGNVNR